MRHRVNIVIITAASIFVNIAFLHLLTGSALSHHGNGSVSEEYRVQEKKRIVVSTILEAPYMMMKQNSAWLAHADRFEGYLADILERLAETVGFTYDIKLARDGLVGSKIQDGGWNGVIGEVARGEADVGAGALVVTRESSQVVSFSEPFLSLRSSILLRKAGRNTKKHRLQKHRNHSLFADSSSRKQSYEITVVEQSRPLKKITSLSQLLQTDYVIGVVKDSASEVALKSSSDPVYRAVWRRILSNRSQSSLVNNLQEGLDRVKRERFALILESPMAEYQATRSPCELYASEPFLDVLYYSFAMQKSSSAKEFRESFNRELAGLKASDEMQTLYLKWWRDQCFGSHLTETSEYFEADLSRRYADPVSPSSGRSGAAGVGFVNYFFVAWAFLLCLFLLT